MTEYVKQYSFKEGLPIEIEVISLEELFEKNKDALTSPHRTSFYHIIFYTEGSPTHLVDFKPVKMEPGSFLFIGKDQVHFFDSETKFKGKAILFTANFFALTDNDLKFLHHSFLFNDFQRVSTIHANADSSILISFQEIEKELSHPADPYQHHILKNHLHNLLLAAERELQHTRLPGSKKGADLDYSVLFRDMLEKNFRKIKTVQSYAKQIQVSEKRLSKATANTFGKTPKQIIDDRVLLEAKRMLVHSSLSIKEIGFDVGFEETTNFIKYFKKHTGKTPTEFRESFL
jgi:AraC family transcriptional regulator, transcriptional activator of pobA